MKSRKIPKLKPGQEYSFYANPFYDEILVFLDRVPTAQEKYKPSKEYPGFYKKYDKDNVKVFQQSIRKRLNEKKKDWWPIKEHLFAVVTVAGPKKNVNNVDIDNLLKTIFDTLKGIVFKDDSQITTVVAEKELMPESIGFSVGLKKIKPFEHMEFLPDLFSGGENAWIQETEQKRQNGLITSFDSY